ncbi:MAG: response regulator transcription factor [Campylobacterota bacterium]|nr:response regulator transcription factor [Campylobacterota bacterium]
MIYVCSKSEYINNYWKNEFSEQYAISYIEKNSFDFGIEFKNDDLLVLDLEQFSTLEEQILFFNNIQKSLKVIALVDEPKLAHGAYLIKKGFKSYLGKKTNKLIVEQVIRTVIDGNIWLYPELMNYIIKHINVNSEDNGASEALNKLSVKEQEVANFVSEGLSNKEIAQKLDVQLVTIKKHISSIFTKLKIKDRVALAILINR